MVAQGDSPVASVLIVDDRPENLLALEGILKPLGARIVKARSGEEALLHLLRETFAVILLDVQMPRLDGLQTAELIKQLASDGVKLHGWLFRASDPAAPLLVFFHGNAGNITVRGPIAAELARRGVSTFVFEAMPDVLPGTRVERRGERVLVLLGPPDVLDGVSARVWARTTSTRGG